MGMKKAVALRYEKGLAAPVVTAKGEGFYAERIVSIASENNIAVVKDEKLSESLFTLNVGDYITEEYYEIVAEILAFILEV